jgi:hypothetical protein
MRAATATLVASALFFGGCGGSGPDDRDAVLRLAEGARGDLVAGRAESFCARLTPHGRARSLGFKVDFDREGTIPSKSPRLPQTCEQVVARERKPESDTWLHTLRAAKLRVSSIDSDSATVELMVPGQPDPLAQVMAVKTASGWRLDDSNVIPVGH